MDLIQAIVVDQCGRLWTIMDGEKQHYNGIVFLTCYDHTISKLSLNNAHENECSSTNRPIIVSLMCLHYRHETLTSLTGLTASETVNTLGVRVYMYCSSTIACVVCALDSVDVTL